VKPVFFSPQPHETIAKSKNSRLAARNEEFTLAGSFLLLAITICSPSLLGGAL
jgi:hypothetical protein